MDLSLFFWINSSLSNLYFDAFFPFITDLHKNIYFKSVVIPLLLVLLFQKYSKKGFLIFLFCAVNLSTIDLVGNHAFKQTIQRLRPGDNPSVEAVLRAPYGGYSFISNHAANIFGFALFMGYFLRKFRYLLFLVAILVGFSRVYNGVHFPTDVLAGAIIGMIISFGYIRLYVRFFGDPHEVKKVVIP